MGLIYTRAEDFEVSDIVKLLAAAKENLAETYSKESPLINHWLKNRHLIHPFNVPYFNKKDK